ncbi:MAG: DNA glycosylase AlkZ-like family protein [Acidimicrobiia bacterium]
MASDLKELASPVETDFGEDARLLPSFDVYLQTRDRESLILGNADRRLVYRDQGWISAIVLLKGRVGGVWTYKKSALGLSIEVVPFVRFGKKVTSAIKRQAESLAEFLESNVADLVFRS